MPRVVQIAAVVVMVVVRGVRHSPRFVRGAGRWNASSCHRTVAMTASMLPLLIDNDIPQNVAYPELDIVGTAEAWAARHCPFHGAIAKPDPAKIGTRIPRVSGCRCTHIKYPARNAPTESGSGAFCRGEMSFTTGADRLRVQGMRVTLDRKGRADRSYSYLRFFE